MGNEAAEKTEEATERRRKKERDRGNVSKSRDFDAALVLTAAIALLSVLGKHMFQSILDMMRETFGHLNPYIDATNILGIMLPYFYYLGIIVVPLCIFSYYGNYNYKNGCGTSFCAGKS